jgi:hypothetical protein
MCIGVLQLGWLQAPIVGSAVIILEEGPAPRKVADCSVADSQIPQLADAARAFLLYSFSWRAKVR